MKVVQINILSRDRSTGRTTDELHNYLINHGHSSFVAYGIGAKDNDPSFFKIGNKFDYYSHNLLSRIFGTQGFHSKCSTKKLIKWLDRIKPDVVHLRNLHSNYLNLELLIRYLKKNNISVVITTHDFWFLTAFCPYPKNECDILKCERCKIYKRKPTLFYDPMSIFSRKKKLFLDLNHFAIQANSQFSKSIVQKSYLKNIYTEVVYNWIDFNSFYPDPVPDLFNTNKPVVLSVWSSLDEKQERFQFFIKIAKMLNEQYTFVMVGNHSFKTSKYPFIEFHQGTNNIQELRHFYSSADLLFNPSTTDTFGKVVAEAMACGTPCVVFNNQALPELVGDNECGIIVNPFDVSETINAIHQVLDKTKSHYLDKCLKRSRHLFDLQTNCNQLVRLYEKLIYEK